MNQILDIRIAYRVPELCINYEILYSRRRSGTSVNAPADPRLSLVRRTLLLRLHLTSGLNCNHQAFRA